MLLNIAAAWQRHNCAPTASDQPISISALPNLTIRQVKGGKDMQDGSVTVERRKRGPDVLCFRWREAGPDGRRVHRRIVLGTSEEPEKPGFCSQDGCGSET